MTIRPYLDNLPALGDRVYVDPAATVIGRVTLGDDVSIWPGTVLRGDVNYITVGARTNIQDGTIVHVSHDSPFNKQGGQPTIIGQGVTVGHGAIVHACTIGDYALIGMGSTILDGAQIGAYAIVGAGAVIPPGKVIGEGEVWVGNPAKCVRTLDAKGRESLEYSAAHYVKLKDQYLASG
ncbi:gamma carbonic anhydrase family protein [Luteimonas sp. FXH3W]|uniref:Gamma carbonic anhydrase family protein n=1 Tax=Aquilutibacter rugosus TaxID=3115820 RepID=A0ABU7UX50_9GAMM